MSDVNLKHPDYDLKRQKAHPTVVKLKKCPRCGMNRMHPSDKWCLSKDCNYPGPTTVERIEKARAASRGTEPQVGTHSRDCETCPHGHFTHRLKFMKKIIVLAAVLTLLSGCSSLSKLARELKDDPAIVVVRVGSPWGIQSLTRIGGQTNSVEVMLDGTVRINPK